VILVTGATGTIGRALLDQLLHTDRPVRALTRNPDAGALPAGVDVVRGDLGDPDTLVTALTGVDEVFLLSAGPDVPRHDANLARAAALTGVRHVVKLSALTVADPTATDPITTCHRAGEHAVRTSGVPWTFLRPSGFMSNALRWADTIRSHDTVYAPYGSGHTAIIDPYDIAAVALITLTTPGHDHQAYSLTGPAALSPGEQVDILADVIQRPLRYVDVPPPAARQAMTDAGLPDAIADAVIALLATGLEPDSATISPTVEKITGSPPRTFSQWAQTHRHAFIQ
jgi:uncharacterized protein YbjT (DUF2867 family)